MTRVRFLLVFGLVLVLRVSIAARFRGNFDTQSFLIAVQSVVTGQNIYVATDRYNYSPLWSFVATGIWNIAKPDAGTFVFLLGAVQIAADAASTFLLLLIARRRLGVNEEESRRRALLFFSNPISVLISCSHGQFDGLSILFLLAALLFAASPPSGKRSLSVAPSWARSFSVAAMLSLSLLVKHVTIFHPLLFSKRREKGGLPDAAVLAPYAVFAAAFLPYVAALDRIVDNVFLYGGRLSGPVLERGGGIQSLLELAPRRPILFALILLAAVAWALRETRAWELARASLLLFLVLLCFSPSYGVQYLVWPIALGSLYPSAAYGVFTLAGALYHSSAPESVAIPWPIRATPSATWLAAVVWLVTETVRGRRALRGNPDSVSAA
ncbi:MAG: hypothetical protein ABW056_13150 [Thermoanaerobaculia bacterium]